MGYKLHRKPTLGGAVFDYLDYDYDFGEFTSIQGGAPYLAKLVYKYYN